MPDCKFIPSNILNALINNKIDKTVKINENLFRFISLLNKSNFKVCIIKLSLIVIEKMIIAENKNKRVFADILYLSSKIPTR
jgi:hypothetical protein